MTLSSRLFSRLPKFSTFSTFSALAGLALSGLVCISCAAPHPSGRWLGERAVRLAFEEGRVFPHHRYYYVGSRSQPDGVIAVDERFTLKDGPIWTEIQVDEAQLADWRDSWRAISFRFCRYMGGVILTPDGQRAGYWYSPFLYNHVWRDEEGRLIVHQPRDLDGRADCEDVGGWSDLPGR